MKKNLISPIVLILVVVVAAYLVIGQTSYPPLTGPISVVDALGRTVQVELPVDRVIITGKSAFPITSVAYMFSSARSVLYGLDQRTASVPLFRAVDPSIDAKTVSSDLGAGSDAPNVEELAKLNPDLVIFKTVVKLQVAESLESLGISVVYVDLENIDSYLRDVRLMGKLFGEEPRANKIAGYYEEKYRYVLSKTSSLPLSNRPRTLFLFYSVKGGTISFNAPGSRWLQTMMIEVAGGYPLSKELGGGGWNTVSFEQIAQWNPEIIFIVTYSDNPSPASVKENILHDPLWRDVAAVKEGRVYAVPDDSHLIAIGSWDTPNSRWILGQLWMAKKIQPTIFTELDLTAEVRQFYREMYGLDEVGAGEIMQQITGDL
ncbi:MAG: ABC transporter substrate-binding protein [Candidatus Hadarchaeum sp.]|uniref:ABC transporter substrate-binding protein n=1 Tax=Candidatus Hadarchaeum sp. TaxID=2883567 RepID=UPI003175BA4D